MDGEDILWTLSKKIDSIDLFRLAAFYMVGVFVGGFSAIFAYVLTLLNGTHGIAGWAWIFVSVSHIELETSEGIRAQPYSLAAQIVEGAITIGLGVVAWFFLPSFPDQNTFLTQEETLIILERVEKDRGDSVPDALTKEKLFNHLLDWRLWVMGTCASIAEKGLLIISRVTGLMYMCATLPAYAIRSSSITTVVIWRLTYILYPAFLSRLF